MGLRIQSECRRLAEFWDQLDSDGVTPVYREGDLLELVDQVVQATKAIDQNPERRTAYVAAAQERFLHEEGNIEVDDDAVISEGGDDGAYVQAWVWVPADDAGLEPLNDEED